MDHKRNVYLSMRPLEEARALFLGRFRLDHVLASETVPVFEAVGRTLAEPVHARLSAPSYHAAAMDGIAVRAEETFGASASRPVELGVPEAAVLVNTGDVLPQGKNAVIMIEQVRGRGHRGHGNAVCAPPPADAGVPGRAHPRRSARGARAA